MAEYDNTNRGIIGKNDRKSSDKHPDITGSINVEGVEYFIDGWRKEKRDGSGGFYSLSVKRKDKQPGTGVDHRSGQSQTSQQTARDLDDDLPF